VSAGDFVAELDRATGELNTKAIRYIAEHCSWTAVDAQYVDLMERMLLSVIRSPAGSDS
jgi:hypothetical protein